MTRLPLYNIKATVIRGSTGRILQLSTGGGLTRTILGSLSPDTREHTIPHTRDAMTYIQHAERRVIMQRMPIIQPMYYVREGPLHWGLSLSSHVMSGQAVEAGLKA